MSSTFQDLFFNYPYKEFQLKSLGLDPKLMAQYYSSRAEKAKNKYTSEHPFGLATLSPFSDFSKLFNKAFFLLDNFISEGGESGYLKLAAQFTAKGSQADFIIAKIPVDASDSTRALLSSGFYYVCSEAVFSADITKLPPIETKGFENARKSTLADLPILTEISKSTHLDIRYYFDPFFDKQVIKEYYASLLEQSLNSTSQDIFSYEEGGKVLGFITVIYNKALSDFTGQKYGSLDYIAVDSSAQNKSIGYILNNFALYQLKEMGYRYISVKTMGSNYRAIRLLQKNSFQLTSQNTILHYNRK